MKPLLLGYTQRDPFKKAESVNLDPAERDKAHMLVVGSPGSGKSKFLEWMVRGDIMHRQGVCILDIHGALYNDVKHWCTYNYFLTKNIILLDPSTGEYIKGFNPFRRREGVTTDVQVDGMVQALLRVWGAESTNETPTLDRVLRLLFTAMVESRIPLHDAFHLINFDQHDLREDVITSFEHPVIQSAWRQIQNIKLRGEWRSEVLSTENRIFKLAASRTIQRFMGVLDDDFNLDVLDIMNQGKTLLVNLKESGTLSEDNAKAFAALLVNELFKTAIRHRDRDTLGYDPLPFYVYIDEWQNVVTPDIKKILGQARKFGLILILANQDLSQIEEAFSPQLVRLLMTCCQIKVCFGGLNRDDADRMAREMLVGQIDLNETKYEIWATKFRPEYQRDYVFTESTVSGTSTTSGTSVHYAWVDGGWVAAPATIGETTGITSARGEAIADIPILMPVPFKEVTSRALYTKDEQLWRWSDELMEQKQRHCFIKLPERLIIPMLVPFVADYEVLNVTASKYEAKIAQLIAAKSPDQVDAALKQQAALSAPSNPEKAEVSSKWDWGK